MLIPSLSLTGSTAGWSAAGKPSPSLSGAAGSGAAVRGATPRRTFSDDFTRHRHPAGKRRKTGRSTWRSNRRRRGGGGGAGSSGRTRTGGGWGGDGRGGRGEGGGWRVEVPRPALERVLSQEPLHGDVVPVRHAMLVENRRAVLVETEAIREGAEGPQAVRGHGDTVLFDE